MGLQQLGLGASEDRLSRLIEERLKPGSDKKRIDERIWDLFGETWAVMFTDLEGFSRGAKANFHVKTMYGRSNHHNIEAIFKAFARALRGACSRDERMREMLPSTKGLL